MISNPDQSRHQTLVIMICCEVVAFICVFSAAWQSTSLTLWASTLRVGLDLPASFFAIYVSARMLGRDHRNYDYGLGKWENLASLMNVPIMFVGLAFLAFRAVQSFLDPQPVTRTGFGLIVLFVFAVINLLLMLRFRSLHRQTLSPLIFAQFILYRNALTASLLSILALLGARFAGPLGAYFDIAGVLLLAILILQSGLLLLRQSLSALLDENIEESLRLRITHGLASTSLDYHRLHRIRSRHSGGQIFIDLFIEFPSDISVQDLLHRTARIQGEIQSAIPNSEVVIIPCAPSVSNALSLA